MRPVERLSQLSTEYSALAALIIGALLAALLTINRRVIFGKMAPADMQLEETTTTDTETQNQAEQD